MDALLDLFTDPDSALWTLLDNPIVSGILNDIIEDMIGDILPEGFGIVFEDTPLETLKLIGEVFQEFDELTGGESLADWLENLVSDPEGMDFTDVDFTGVTGALGDLAGAVTLTVEDDLKDTIETMLDAMGEVGELSDLEAALRSLFNIPAL
jgi:hypothetical protein